MKRPTLVPRWAARDVMRRPQEAVLVGAALATLIWVGGTATLLTEAVRATASRLIDAGPSLVVRRLDAGGFAPITMAATASIAAIPGALSVRTRVWGPARAKGRPIEVVGLDSTGRAALADAGLALDPIDDKSAVVGPGFTADRGAVVTVYGPGAKADVELQVALPESVGLVAQDTFLVHPDVARRVLGLAPATATDLVLDVFRQSEEDAIRADIADALPYPVVITTRSEAKRRYTASLTRRGGLFIMMLLPAALAVGALVAGAARDRAARAKEVGLLKAIGWTTADIVRMHALRAAWVALPATGAGWLLAWLSVFGPWVQWPAALFLGWTGPPPRLMLDVAGAGVVLIEVTVVALVPWWAASVAPAIIQSAKDPWQALSEDPG